MRNPARQTFVPLTLLVALVAAPPLLAEHPPQDTRWGVPLHVNEAGEITDRPVVHPHRTVVVEPGMRNVRVEGGETVRFVVPNGEEAETFYWRFRTFEQTGLVELQEIAPPGVNLPADAHVWLDPDPRYLG